GRPIITSYFTPWNELEHKEAGWNLDISNEEACLQKLIAVCNMENNEFDKYGKGAHEAACSYYAASSGLDNYHTLFTN
ncbi:MAG: hypothetical protein ACKOU7_11105, partial [Ferruginibacter sp.]